ncbi:protein BCL9 homolog isoform X1 [Diachasmimorpha longicaudata]|uniref:protein BCL9 homolog isoform X1 n=1 Tax=Diachasmimorpha longicaudata TaxID=58733 RepID=UPI0030B8A022
MKTEKKQNEQNCIPSAVVKEETEGDGVKIKEEGNGGNHEDATGDDGNDGQRDAGLDQGNGDGSMPIDNQNGTGNQTMLNSVKQESEHSNANDDLTTDNIQPLVSNVLGKQMGGGSCGEAQYMQQQSQIFVFSTQWANKGAEAVLQGQFPSIVAYHCSQPQTKKYLEKHPTKMNQFRQNPAQWLNNIAMMKQKGQHQPPTPTFPPEQPSDLPPLDPTAPFWNDQPNLRNLNGSNAAESTLDDTNIDVPCLGPSSPGNQPTNSQPPGNPAMGQSPNLLGRTSPGALQPSLQGVKVPDENLTPQQRQHRESQLATIGKLQMMLFPEQKDDSTGLLDPAHVPPAGNVPPVSTPGGPCSTNMEWHKLQHSFLDGKNKVGVGSPGSLRGSGMVGGVPRSQGPPPPYHQTARSASVPIAIPSPNPSSPNNPTSNLSLPSPRASSALNSPADCNRQFQLNAPRAGHLPGQSPTSQDSPTPVSQPSSSVPPSRLNHSNPGTPVSHSHLSSLSPSNTTPQKDPQLDFPTNPPSNVEGMFCRTLQNLAQQKQQQQQQAHNAPGVKEANLMPVPSPQQIQYMNTFDGQELTIQKQPNTSLKDNSLQSATNTTNNQDLSSRMLPAPLDNSNQFPGRTEGTSPTIESMNRGFGGSLHSPHTPHTPHTPGGAPQTPVDNKQNNNNNNNNNNNKTSASAQSSPVPMNPSLGDSMGPPRTIPASPSTKQETSSPSSKDMSQPQQQPPQQVSQQSQIQSQMQSQMPPQQSQAPQNPQQSQINQQNNQSNSGVPMGQMNAFPCSRPPVNVSQPDNVPLNPNNIGSRMGGMGGMNANHFDPITSLAQMSQQLTNTAASNALGNDGPMHGGNMMPFGGPHGMHMMQMGGELNGCHLGPVNEPSDVGMCMGMPGGPPTSYSPTTSHTGSPTIGPTKISHGMMGHGMMPGHNVPGGYPGSEHVPPPRLMGHNVGPSPYNGANIQVKPSAPNTIQYLPARPNVGHPPRGPSNLDLNFLQRFTNPPMQNMESKMSSPSVNLPYFPNGCMPNNMGGPHSGMNMGPGGLPGMGGGPPRMDGQINSPHGGMRPALGNMRPQPNIMRMQHMVGGGVFPGSPMDPDKVFPPDMAQQVGNQQNPGMYVPGSKGSPMGLGPPPDTTQPLPPSMGGGSSNFKNSPFAGGPSMADPNYAQQFHNFQQQLYATGSRAAGPPQPPPPHPNIHPTGNSHSHQQFFIPNTTQTPYWARNSRM